MEAIKAREYWEVPRREIEEGLQRSCSLDEVKALFRDRGIDMDRSIDQIKVEVETTNVKAVEDQKLLERHRSLMWTQIPEMRAGERGLSFSL